MELDTFSEKDLNYTFHWSFPLIQYVGQENKMNARALKNFLEWFQGLFELYFKEMFIIVYIIISGVSFMFLAVDITFFTHIFCLILFHSFQYNLSKVRLTTTTYIFLLHFMWQSRYFSSRFPCLLFAKFRHKRKAPNYFWGLWWDTDTWLGHRTQDKRWYY